MPTTPHDWDVQVLKDLGIQSGSALGGANPAYQADLNFLNAWQTRETGDKMPNLAHYNLLGNMGQPGTYGGTPVNNYLGNGGGLLSYPSMEQGAADTAHRISLYGDLSGGFQQGMQTGTNYAGLSKWSGGGYSSIGGSGGNPNSSSDAYGAGNDKAGAASAGINNALTAQQIDLQKQLATIDEEYARKEAAFQQRLLGLSKSSLGIQEGGLDRQLKEAPLLQADVNRLYQLQFAGIGVRGQGVNEQYRQALTDQASHGASSGSLFTKGHRDEHANTMADWSRATYFLQNQRASLQAQQHQEAVGYLEKLAAFADQKKQYDIISQRYGIQGEEIDQRLKSTLQQTAIGAGQAVTSLFQQMLNTDAGLMNTLAPPPMTGGLASGDPYSADPSQGPAQGSYGGGYPFTYTS